MSPLPIILILISTLGHAGWNLMVRVRRREAAFMRRMLIASVPIGLVVATICQFFPHAITGKAWLCVIGSGVFCAFYYHFLGLAYSSSDFTVVYPVARAVPVLLLGLVDLLRGHYPTMAGWVGMVMVVCGCAMAPLSSPGDLSVRHYVNRAVLWMLLTACATVGYTLLDKVALESIHAFQKGPAGPAIYGFLFHTSACGFYLLLCPAFRTGQEGADEVGWKYPALAACLGFLSYWLVLWAYQLAAHASYIVAFRQFSIVIGVVLAFVLFREHGMVIRLAATAAITAGLVIIALLGA